MHIARLPYFLPLLLFLGSFAISQQAVAQSDWTPIPARDVLLEVYYHSDLESDRQQLAAAEQFAAARKGLRVVARDLTDNPKNQERLAKVLTHYQLPAETHPAIYGCNRVIHGLTKPEDVGEALKTLLRFDVYTRAGCHRCDEAKELLPGFLEQYPAFELHYLDIGTNSKWLQELNQLVKVHRQAAASTPAMHFCNQLQIGFDRTNVTPDRLHKALGRWTVPAKSESTKKVSEVTGRRPF